MWSREREREHKETEKSGRFCCRGNCCCCCFRWLCCCCRCCCPCFIFFFPAFGVGTTACSARSHFKCRYVVKIRAGDGPKNRSHVRKEKKERKLGMEIETDSRVMRAFKKGQGDTRGKKKSDTFKRDKRMFSLDFFCLRTNIALSKDSLLRSPPLLSEFLSIAL